MSDAINKHLSSFLFNQAQSLSRSGEAKHQALKNTELEKACQGFESIFVNHLMQKMRETVPQSGFLGGGHAEKIYTTMLDGEISKTVSEQRGIGLARMMYEQMAAANRKDK